MSACCEKSPSEELIKTALRITQMDCPTEEALIRKRLQSVGQVKNLEFDLMQRILTVHHTENGLEKVVSALKSIGMAPKIIGANNTDSSADTVKPNMAKMLWPLVVALILAICAEVAYWMNSSIWLQLVPAFLAIAISGFSTYKKGWLAIINRNLNINALMSIAVTGALILGEWPEAAMVMVLFAFAEAIEARSLDHARKSVARLMDVAPEKVTVQRNEAWVAVAVKDVPVGAIVRVAPGERIGLDGIVVSGNSEVNQAPITGESALQPKFVGDNVYAGSINGMAELHYEVTASSDNTMLARIIHAVHHAQSRKAPTQRFVDRFSQIYTPVVCLLALAVAILPPVLLGASWYEWGYRALVLLVIACPCALVISTPVAVVSALGSAARNGVLIKGGVYLEQGRNLKAIAFDKTGTLTSGVPVLVSALPQIDGNVNDRELSIAYTLASRSDHPVSAAIAKGLSNNESNDRHSIEALPVESLNAVAGGGLQANVNGQTYYLGSISWVRSILDESKISANQHNEIRSLQEQGSTVSVLANNTGLLVIFAVQDSLKDHAAEAVRTINSMGIHTVMLSGDNQFTVQHIASQAGIENAYGGLMPDEKLAHINKLMAQGVTGMAGDGINDAPALAQSDIGFAMGAMGTDTAIETADVALMDDDLRKLPYFISLSQRTNNVLRQNISCALGIKAIFLVATLFGVATMWMAVFADVGASLIVIANSLRLLSVRKKLS